MCAIFGAIHSSIIPGGSCGNWRVCGLQESDLSAARSEVLDQQKQVKDQVGYLVLAILSFLTMSLQTNLMNFPFTRLHVYCEFLSNVKFVGTV